MKVIEDRAALVDLLKDHEIALSKLYAAYAERFPFQKDFWADLSADEMVHADMLDLLKSKVKELRAIYNKDRFREGAIESSIDYIEHQTEEARTGRILLINALSIALDLEKSIIDKKYFEAVEGDSVDVKRILASLTELASEHLECVHEQWQKYRHKP